MGPKWTLATGGVGYSLLAASFWCYNHTKNRGLVYFGGAICGIPAAFLWTAAGSLIMSLPAEKDKGRYISIFYAFQFTGGVIGAIIPTLENWSVTTAGAVNDGTYIALFILMFSGSIVALLVVKPQTIIQNDGSRVQVERETTFSQELKNVCMSMAGADLEMRFCRCLGRDSCPEGASHPLLLPLQLCRSVVVSQTPWSFASRQLII